MEATATRSRTPNLLGGRDSWSRGETRERGWPTRKQHLQSQRGAQSGPRIILEAQEPLPYPAFSP